MIKQSIQASDFGKKPYVAPQMETVPAESSDIICTSPTAIYYPNEEYEEEETDDWFS